MGVFGRNHHLLKTFLACTLLVLALSLFSFHDISRNSEINSRTPASQGVLGH